METREIFEFNAYDFCMSLQQAILDGYRVSSLNEFFPQLYQGSCSATLVKEEPKQEVQKKEVAKVVEDVVKEPSESEILKEALIEKLGAEQIGGAEVPPVPPKRGRPARS